MHGRGVGHLPTTSQALRGGYTLPQYAGGFDSPAMHMKLAGCLPIISQALRGRLDSPAIHMTIAGRLPITSRALGGGLDSPAMHLNVACCLPITLQGQRDMSPTIHWNRRVACPSLHRRWEAASTTQRPPIHGKKF